MRKGITGTYLLSSLIFFLFVSLKYPVAPSDPLQYLNLAISPYGSNFFIDRLSVITLLKLFNSIFGGYYAVYFLSVSATIISSVVAFKLVNHENKISFFSVVLMLMLNNVVVSNFGYGYPTQVGFCLQILSVYCILHGNNGFLNSLLATFLIIMLMFSKIQYIPTALLLFAVFIYRMNSDKRLGLAVAVTGLSGLVFLFLTGFILEASVPDLVRGYFSGEFSKQYQGRDAGGLPPFYILIFEPAFVMATIGIVATLRNSHSKHLKLLALVGVSDLVFLLFIYVVTARGGPVIFNYFYSYYFIGSLCFLVMFINNVNQGFTRLLTWLLLLMIVVIAYIYPIGFSYLSLGDYLVYKIWFVVVGLAFMTTFAFREKISSSSKILLLLLFIGPGMGSVFELMYKRSLAMSYISLFERAAYNPQECAANSKDKFLVRYINAEFLNRTDGIDNYSLLCKLGDGRLSLTVKKSRLRGFYVAED